MAIEDNVRALESAVHRFLHDKRRRGEWFDVPITDNAHFEDLIVQAIQWVQKEQEKRDTEALRHGPHLGIIDKHAAFLALRLVTEMHRQHLTIPKLAKASHVPLSTVQKLVAGFGKHPSVWTIWAIAQALGVSVDWLLGTTDHRQASS